jgi:cobalt-zinc-cadmium efflux system membrane fusion protein
MRLWILLLLLSSMPLLLACDRAADEGAPQAAHEEPAADASHQPVAQTAGVLAIDPEMLRDLRITTTRAEARSGGEGVTLLGEVRVNEDAFSEVGVPIAARVVEVLASPGDRVEARQALAKLESPELGKARAEAVAARARASLARRALQRKRELAAERIVAGREVQEAQFEATAAEAELRAAEGALRALGVEAEEAAGEQRVDPVFTLRSPIAGSVLDRSVVRGQMTEPGKTLFRVGDLARLWLTVHAFERDAIRVAPGSQARLTFPALPGRTLVGQVTLIGSQVDTTSRTLPIRVEVENSDGVLRPGMSAAAWIPIGDETDTIVAVPAAAVQRTDGGWAVFLPRDEGAFEVRGVGRGRDLGGDVEIVSGLAPGERVVVDGAFLLKAEREKSRGAGDHHDH